MSTQWQWPELATTEREVEATKKQSLKRDAISVIAWVAVY